MANAKLTDKTELLTPADGDWLYIVDTSDTSESPQGTSKKIKKVNVASANTSTVLDTEYIYLSGSPQFNLPLNSKVSAVFWNGTILRRADWTLTVNVLTINFTPSVNDVFQPIGII